MTSQTKSTLNKVFTLFITIFLAATGGLGIFMCILQTGLGVLGMSQAPTVMQEMAGIQALTVGGIYLLISVISFATLVVLVQLQNETTNPTPTNVGNTPAPDSDQPVHTGSPFKTTRKPIRKKRMPASKLEVRSGDGSATRRSKPR